MKYKYVIFIIGLFFSKALAFGQAQSQTLSGLVTFVTTSNAYVKFDNTDDIQLGDTLMLSSSDQPCLVLTNKSSISCVCSILNNCDIKKGDQVTYQVKFNKSISVIPNEEVNPAPDTLIKEEVKSTQDIRGRVSLSSYSTFFSDREDRHRLMARFALTANHIANSNISFETYLNYRQILLPSETSFTAPTTYFRAYTFSLKYDISPSLYVAIGRRINRRAWSLGAIDGIQSEKLFGKNYVGAIIGFRPDITEYSINTDLLEYGGYYGRVSNTDNVYSDVTVGVVEQRNGNAIDRRYTFLQYSSTLFKKLTLFGSMELDLYTKLNMEVTTNPRLTNLFLSGRYRITRKIDVSLSYDSRKRIVYYETFQTEVEQILDDDMARQGLRARINVRVIKNLSFGLSYSKRFQSDLQNKSDNYYFYSSIAKLPGVGGRLMVSYNINKSNYLQNNILSFQYSRTIVKNKLNGDFYYRILNYKYEYNISSIKQNYIGASLSYHMTRKLLLSVSGEISNYNQENNYRIYAKIAQRF